MKIDMFYLGKINVKKLVLLKFVKFLRKILIIIWMYSATSDRNTNQIGFKIPNLLTAWINPAAYIIRNHCFIFNNKHWYHFPVAYCLLILSNLRHDTCIIQLSHFVAKYLCKTKEECFILARVFLVRLVGR
jgi:hypothetical protein